MPKLSKAQLTKKSAFRRLKKLLSKTGKRNLLWYHDIGRSVQSLCPSESRAYGEGRIQALAVALRKPKTFGATLWGTRSFFEKFGRDEVRALCKPETPSGFVLTWSHMVHLLSLDDVDYLEFELDCLAGEWSSKELHRRIKEFREPKGKGGRRFRKPNSVEDALRQLIYESRTWDRRYCEVWFHLDKPAISLEAGKGKSGELAELGADAIQVLETVKFDIEDCLPRLKGLAAWNRKKSGRRTKKRG